MDNDRSTAGYWAAAIIVVLAIVAAVWWYTAASNTSPLVPNTGDTTNTTQMQNATDTTSY